MLDVIVVVFSLDVLALGASGAGYLNAALGAGAVIGSLVALSLIGRPSLVAPLLASVFAWALTIAVLGAWPTIAGSFLLLATAGTARSLLDVSARTLLQRVTPSTARAGALGSSKDRQPWDSRSARFSSRCCSRRGALRSSCSAPEHCSPQPAWPRRQDCGVLSRSHLHRRASDMCNRRAARPPPGGYRRRRGAALAAFHLRY